MSGLMYNPKASMSFGRISSLTSNALYRTKRDEAAKRCVDFCRSLVTDVLVGGDRIVDGWRVQ
ncbi:hypothetical protein DXT89_10595 [Agrobacterium vitis]|uniref:Uncharacterized protein n=1 Tax=Agrobacterium vitis TaxID=373 RepID=A0A368NWS8_AGRVI|nr:hypothetical protein DXM22_13220 [Agrobacterium vitis]KAA3528446.1 hypothetical protein DXT89_10595 [Agrobacterium vitis]RCU54473.1 hypothetical protein ASB66_005250 [Agrobacterium vitis]